MNRAFLYLFLLLAPIIILVMVNESVRPTLKETPFQIKGVKAMNPYAAKLDRCTWHCYRETTSHCKKYHTTFARPYFKHIDPLYFTIIKSMHSGGNYQLMNVVFLVIFIPLLTFYLLVKSIEMGYCIKALKKNP